MRQIELNEYTIRWKEDGRCEEGRKAKKKMYVHEEVTRFYFLRSNVAHILYVILMIDRYFYRSVIFVIRHLLIFI